MAEIWLALRNSSAALPQQSDDPKVTRPLKKRHAHTEEPSRFRLRVEFMQQFQQEVSLLHLQSSGLKPTFRLGMANLLPPNKALQSNHKIHIL